MLRTAFVKKLATIAKRHGDNFKVSIYRFAVQNGFLRYTNGHFLYETRVDMADRSISIEEMAKGSELAKLDKKKELSEVDLIEFKCDPLNENGNYPDCDRLHTLDAVNEHIQFNARYLKDICELAIASGSDYVTLHHESLQDENTRRGRKVFTTSSPTYVTWNAGIDKSERYHRVLIMPVFSRDHRNAKHLACGNAPEPTAEQQDKHLETATAA